MGRGPSENYFKIDNQVWDALTFVYDIPKTEKRVLGWIIRNSYGMRAADRCSVDRQKLAKLLGVSKRTVEKCLLNLENSNAIIKFESPKRGKHTLYGPNEEVQEWSYESLCDGVGWSPIEYAEPAYETGVNEYADPAYLSRPNQRTHCVQTSVPNGQEKPVTTGLAETPKDSLKKTVLKDPPNPQGDDDDFFDQNLPLGSNQVSTIDDVRKLPKDLTFIASFAQADGFLRKFWSAACLSYIETESLKAYYAHNRDQYNPKQLLGNILLAAQEESDRRASTPSDQHRYLGKPIAKTIAAAGPRLLAKRKAATEPQRPQAEDWSRKDRDRPERRKTA